MSGYVSTRNRGKKEVIFPIFQECCKIVDDDFWKSLYEELSYGKYPKGLYIKGHDLCNTNKRKFFAYNFLYKEAKEIIEDIHKLILENTNIYSNKDKKNKKKDIEKFKADIQSHINVEKFSMIKKKSIRELMITNFVIDMQKKYKLKWSEARNLLNIIQMGFIEKTISSNDVIFKDGKIKKIKGITYDGESFINENKSKLKDEVKVPDHFYMNKIWNKKVIKKSKRPSQTLL